MNWPGLPWWKPCTENPVNRCEHFRIIYQVQQNICHKAIHFEAPFQRLRHDSLSLSLSSMGSNRHKAPVIKNRCRFRLGNFISQIKMQNSSKVGWSQLLAHEISLDNCHFGFPPSLRCASKERMEIQSALQFAFDASVPLNPRSLFSTEQAFLSVVAQ